MGLFDFVSNVVKDAVDIVSDVAVGTVDMVGNVVSGTVDVAGSAVSGAADFVSSAVGGTVDVIGDVASGAVDVAGSVASGAADFVSSAVGGTVDVIGDVASGAVDAIGSSASEAIDYISENPVKTLLGVAAAVVAGRAAPAIITTVADASVIGSLNHANNKFIGGDVRYSREISLPGIPTDEEMRKIVLRRMPGSRTEMPLPESPDYKKMMDEAIKLVQLMEEIKNKQPVNTLEMGSVVYCHLALLVEHSGIYVGDNQIVHLNGDGLIEKVSPKEFVARLGGLNPDLGIFVSCEGESAIGSVKFAERAISMIGYKRNYHVMMDNCHQFAAGCVTGDFENSCNFKTLLDSLVREHLNADTWRLWNRNE